MKFNIVYPNDKRWTKQADTTINVKTMTIQDYLAGFDIIDYKYDVKYADTLIEILNSGVFGPLKCTAFDAYYDTVTVTLDMAKIHPLSEYNAIAKTPADTLYHLINQQPFIIHFIRTEKREIDKESNPTTVFRGDGVVKIPSEALLEYWG